MSLSPYPWRGRGAPVGSRRHSGSRSPGRWRSPPARSDKHHAMYVRTSVTPIDANGNSLAGQSESAQEAVYAGIDVNLSWRPTGVTQMLS